VKGITEKIRLIRIVEGEGVSVIDTGIGYKDSYKMMWCRESEVRKVSCHVKVEVLIGNVMGVFYPSRITLPKMISPTKLEMLTKKD
jgi:hypothetical protein